MAEGDEPLEFATFIGAAEDVSIERLALYIPSKDRSGNLIVQEQWIERGMRLLAEIGGGATRLPVEGIWKDGEKYLEESVMQIYTFLDPDKFYEHLNELREFLHSMGEETKQGEVVIELRNRLYKIREFAPTGITKIDPP